MGIVTVCIGVFSVLTMISASAIPMWEYLSKDEKMAYLYNMFANQVEDYCNFSTMDECNTELLKYGLKNLHGMPEDHLDIMDPYQRGANTLIWESMMEGHAMMKKSSKINSQSTTVNPRDQYDYFSESNYLGSASSRQETFYNNGRYVHRPASVQAVPVTTTAKPTKKHFGPMVVKVHLDGRPVHEEEKSVPADDDLHHHHIVRTKVPAISHFEGGKKENALPVMKMGNPYPYAVYARPARR